MFPVNNLPPNEGPLMCRYPEDLLICKNMFKLLPLSNSKATDFWTFVTSQAPQETKWEESVFLVSSSVRERRAQPRWFLFDENSI